MIISDLSRYSGFKLCNNLLYVCFSAALQNQDHMDMIRHYHILIYMHILIMLINPINMILYNVANPA